MLPTDPSAATPAAPASPASPAPAAPVQPAANTPEGGQAGQQQVAPAYVTKEDLIQLMDQRDERLVKRARQSTSDLINNRLKTYDEVVKLQEKAGAPIPPESQKLARQAILESSLTGDAEPGPAPAAPQAAPEPAGSMSREQWSSIVMTSLADTFTAAGQEVVPGDPEWAPVEKELTDPAGSLGKLLATATKAADAKKARLTSSGNTAQARVSASGGNPGHGLGPDVSGHDLFQVARSGN